MKNRQNSLELTLGTKDGCRTEQREKKGSQHYFLVIFGIIIINSTFTYVYALYIFLTPLPSFLLVSTPNSRYEHKIEFFYSSPTY